MERTYVARMIAKMPHDIQPGLYIYYIIILLMSDYMFFTCVAEVSSC